MAPEDDPKNEFQSTQSGLMEIIKSRINHLSERLDLLRGEIGYLEDMRGFLGAQEPDVVEGNLGTMVSRALAYRPRDRY